jgi:gamma-glutamyl-gamma-aminobutyrate hydrolase PuuD
MSMTRRPVVGISAAFERARWAVWVDVEVNVSQRTYTDRVDAAGGLPLLLPASEAGTADPGAVLDRVDALLLAGGADLDPASYGQEPDPATSNYRRARDDFEIALCREAIARRMPVLGVCRGLQVLNVARGGDLVQHLADAQMHVHTPGRFSDHEVRLEPGSLAAEAAPSGSRCAPITTKASAGSATASSRAAGRSPVTRSSRSSFRAVTVTEGGPWASSGIPRRNLEAQSWPPSSRPRAEAR